MGGMISTKFQPLTLQSFTSSSICTQEVESDPTSTTEEDSSYVSNTTKKNNTEFDDLVNSKKFHKQYLFNSKNYIKQIEEIKKQKNDLSFKKEIKNPSNCSNAFLNKKQSIENLLNDRAFLPSEEYLFEYKIGNGAFSNVYLAKNLKDGLSYAIKAINYSDHAQMAMEEAKILCYLQNLNLCDYELAKGKKFIVKYFGELLLKGCYCLVFEKLSISLSDFLEKTKYKPFSVSNVRLIAAQLCAALDFIHNCGIIHTDIKPENIVLCDPPSTTYDDKHMLNSCHIKLIDFGLACWKDDPPFCTVTTRPYRAPEVILRLHWSCAIDIWSVGCTLFKLYSGYHLFPSTKSNLQHIYMMRCILGPFPSLLRNNRLDYFKVIDRRLRNHPSMFEPLGKQRRGETGDKALFHLLHQMLEIDVSKRPSANQCLLHPFLIHVLNEI